MHANACEAARPFWFENNTLNEVAFCEDFLKKHPMLSVGGQFFSVDGRIHDEESIRKEIYEALRPFMTTGLAKRASSLLEMLRLEAYAPELPVHEDRLHLKNGTLYLDGKFTQNKEFCRNRLPVNYKPDAARPETWLRFLRELLEPEDILTLQEFMGYCLVPTTRGQTMLLIKGNGDEGKSRIGVVMQAIFGSNLKNGSIAKVEHSPFARMTLFLQTNFAPRRRAYFSGVLRA